MCGCNKNRTPDTYIVTLPNGTTKEVAGQFAARVEVTKAGGGSYKIKT